jgi:hypothetical protein
LQLHRPSTTHALRISIIAARNNVALMLLALIRRFVELVGAQDSSHCCRTLTTTTASATMKMDTLERAAWHARGLSLSLALSLYYSGNGAEPQGLRLLALRSRVSGLRLEH